MLLSFSFIEVGPVGLAIVFASHYCKALVSRTPGGTIFGVCKALGEIDLQNNVIPVSSLLDKECASKLEVMFLLKSVCSANLQAELGASVRAAHHFSTTLSRFHYTMASSTNGVEETMTKTHLSEEPAKNDDAQAAMSKKGNGSKFKIYTKTGDAGQTSLYNGSRRSKTDLEFEALGDVDELNSAIGVAREFLDSALANLSQQLEEIQSRLIDVGTSIATPLESSNKAKLERAKFPEGKVQLLEQQIDTMDEELAPLRNFILPSGGPGASFLHVARGVCRRAERKVVYLVGQNQVS